MDSSISLFRVTGLCAANFQSFSADGSIDLASIPLHVAELHRQGVSSVFVCGTTGESLKMSVSERKAVLSAWVASAKESAAAGNPLLSIIAHVGAESIADAQELAAHAASAGAVAIGVVPPTFFKPIDVNACCSLLEAIATHAPKLPVYYYHIAIMTGVSIRCDLLLKRVSELQNEGRLTQFRGIKYSDADLHIFANCVAFENGKFDILYGKDEQGLGALAMGAKGFVGSTYNYNGRAANKMIKAFQSNDLQVALAEQRKIQLLVNLLYASSEFGPPGCNVGKAIMEILLGGKGCGAPRLPGAAVSDVSKLKNKLEEIGWFTW
jgi:N-acetylneuraminate lyase